MNNNSLEAIGNNSSIIANAILHEMDNRLTPLQVNKLIYFSHGWLLGLYQKPLISEKIEAWKYGPVIPSVYHTFRDNGKNPISFTDYFDDVYDELNDEEMDIINQVIDGYGDLSGSELIELTHEEDTPWYQCYNESKTNIVIPNQIIKEYFESKIDNGN